MFAPLLSTVAGSLTQGMGGMFGGEDDAQAGKSEATATGTFNAGSLNVTRADNTIMIALIVAGVLAGIVFWKRRK